MPTTCEHHHTIIGVIDTPEGRKVYTLCGCGQLIKSEFVRDLPSNYMDRKSLHELRDSRSQG